MPTPLDWCEKLIDKRNRIDKTTPEDRAALVEALNTMKLALNKNR